MARNNEDITYRGNRRLSGSWGRLYWNNELIFEISKYEAKVTANRETVNVGNDEDSKIVSLKGEGSFTIKQVFTRGLDSMIAAWVAGEDVRGNLVTALDDPDAVNGQDERVSFGNVWFNELMVAIAEKGKVVEKEFPFGFTPSDVQFLSTIA